MNLLNKNQYSRLIQGLVAAFIVFAAIPDRLFAEDLIKIADRHVFMLHPGQDAVWGTYMFGVKNDGDSPANFKHSVSLPADIIDFQPQEGLQKDELKVDTNGSFYFEKEFPTGLTLIAIGFKLSSHFGSLQLNFQPSYDIEDFSVLTKKGGLVLHPDSNIMQKAESAKMANDKYDSLKSVAMLKAGSDVQISISNIPQGRGQYWLIGSVFAGLIVLLSVMMTVKTRVTIKEDASVV